MLSKIQPSQIFSNLLIEMEKKTNGSQSKIQKNLPELAMPLNKIIKQKQHKSLKKMNKKNRRENSLLCDGMKSYD